MKPTNEKYETPEVSDIKPVSVLVGGAGPGETAENPEQPPEDDDPI